MLSLLVSATTGDAQPHPIERAFSLSQPVVVQVGVHIECHDNGAYFGTCKELTLQLGRGPTKAGPLYSKWEYPDGFVTVYRRHGV